MKSPDSGQGFCFSAVWNVLYERYDRVWALADFMQMTPRHIVETWIERFNAGDAAGLTELYHPDAINHQVTQDPIKGRDAIRATFEREFSTAEMVAFPKSSMRPAMSLRWNGATLLACVDAASSRLTED